MCGKNARANYFSVRDLPTFQAWCETLGLRVSSNPEQNPGLITILFDDGVPTDYYDAATHELRDVDFFNELGPHLNDGQVAIIIATGHEEMYLYAYAIAVNSAGESREVSLESIYELAQEIAPAEADIIRAEY